jgi:hypothetical protein
LIAWAAANCGMAKTAAVSHMESRIQSFMLLSN